MNVKFSGHPHHIQLAMLYRAFMGHPACLNFLTKSWLVRIEGNSLQKSRDMLEVVVRSELYGKKQEQRGFVGLICDFKNKTIYNNMWLNKNTNPSLFLW